MVAPNAAAAVAHAAGFLLLKQACCTWFASWATPGSAEDPGTMADGTVPPVTARTLPTALPEAVMGCVAASACVVANADCWACWTPVGTVMKPAAAACEALMSSCRVVA